MEGLTKKAEMEESPQGEERVNQKLSVLQQTNEKGKGPEQDHAWCAAGKLRQQGAHCGLS